MDYPSAEDYVQAIQNPGAGFRVDRFRGTRFALHPRLGIPIPRCGSSAAVFRATVDGQERALRFLICAGACSPERNDAVRDYLRRSSLDRHVVTAEWVDNAIEIGGRTWPMQVMEWVDGQPLGDHVDQLIDSGDTARLPDLANAWRSLVHDLPDWYRFHFELLHRIDARDHAELSGAVREIVAALDRR